MTDVLERYRAMLETPSVLAVDPCALLRDMAAEIERLRSPPLRAREEIARQISGLIERLAHCDTCWPATARIEPDKALEFADALSRTAGQEWRDISSETKDGTVFIYQSEDEAVSTCSWQSDDCGFGWWDIQGDQTAYPVRWMPLPAPPVAEPKP